MPRAIAAVSKLKVALRGYALAFPGAWLDHPWNEDHCKVGKKGFLSLSFAEGPETNPWMTMKLPESGAGVLMLACAKPAGYGLGKSGWVTFDLTQSDCPPRDVFQELIEESYRAVAPKTLVKELDAR